MIKLKDLLNKTSDRDIKKLERALKTMEKFAIPLGFKRVDKREAERYDKELVNDTDDGVYWLGGFIKGKYEHVFVYSDGWANWSEGYGGGNDGYKDFLDKDYWSRLFG